MGMLYGYAQTLPLGPPKIMGGLYQLPLQEKDYQPSGEFPQLYIHKRWSMGEFTTMEGKKYGDFPLRFDLLGENLEILIQGNQIKLLALGQLKSFTWVYPNTGEWEKYISSIPFQQNKGEEEERGVMQVLFKGKIKLLAFQQVHLIPAFYIPQLDAGNREDTYQLEDKFFMVDLRGNLKPIPKRTKALGSLFYPYGNEVRRYIKKHFLTLRKEEDLIRIVTFFEGLVENSK